MKFATPINPNYCATIFKIKVINVLPNCDNVVATPIFGFQAIVNKETKVGDIGVVFTSETQLSEDYCKENNLYRHQELNKDKEQKGYLEDNRRVRSIKFRGHRSDCLFMPLSSLKYTKVKIEDLVEGAEFDFIEDKKICEKYIVKTKIPGTGRFQEKKYSRVEEKFMPEHFKNDNYFKVSDGIDPNVSVIITQKLHGTSVRIGNTIVRRKPNLIERIAKLFGAKITETEFDYIFGSRKVIKDANSPDKTDGFYDFDIWTQEGKKLEGLLPENFIVYAELIGWTPQNAALQKNYAYNLSTGTCAMLVYRIAVINHQGRTVDLSWDQVKEMCAEMGVAHVPELWRGKASEIDTIKFLDKRFSEEGYRDAIPLGDNKELVDEGICIRIDGLTPQIFKAKSPIFLAHETKLLDEGIEDLEETQI